MTILEPADLVVIAAGPSGLAAAIAAAEKGASVVVFEKNATAGGASNMGMGPLGIDTSVQKKDLINITKDEAFKKFMNYTHYRSDARLVREYLYKSGDTIEWLIGMGVEFEGSYKYFSLNGAEAVWHVVKSDTGRHGGGGAGTMIKRMCERAEELGVEFHFETPAYEILRDEKRITGVRARDAAGEEYEIECAAVVIATGGFGDNPEMIHREMGYTWGKDLKSVRVPGVIGDGMKMAWKVGAAKTETSIEQSGGTLLEGHYRSLISAANQPNLMVNLKGERIMNEESMGNSNFRSNVCIPQKGHRVYSIFDDSIVQFYEKNGYDIVNMVGRQVYPVSFLDDVKAAEENHDPGFASAYTIGDLADQVGINRAQLEKTVEEYNQMCNTRDSLFFKPQKYMKPLVGPKFYCVTHVAGGYGTLGGIKINYKTEVVDDGFQPIPGLYASGTDTCTIYADSYVFILPGNTMGYALNTGRMAGEHAVDYAIDLYEAMDE